VQLTATVVNPPPSITVVPSPLNFGNVITNMTLTNTLVVTGAYLTNNVTVAPPPASGFTISTDNVTFASSSLVLPTNTLMGLAITNVYVKFAPTTQATYGGVITNTSDGAATQTVTLAGAGVVQSLHVGNESLAFGVLLANTISTTNSFTLWGSNLEANVTVTAPTAYEVSTNSATPGSFGQSCTVVVPGVSPITGTNLATQTIYVRFNPAAAQSYGGNITNSSTGATLVTKAVSGDGVLALGGDSTYITNNYAVHIFTNVGTWTFTPESSLRAEYLVIGGGGAGGGGASGAGGVGGGGAGGYRSSVAGEWSVGHNPAETPLILVAGSNYVVTVGTGGVGVAKNAGGNGGNSTFASITAYGGGGGNGGTVNSSGTFGSGGGGNGANNSASNGSPWTASQGTRGGHGRLDSPGGVNSISSGGGGGAGYAGADGVYCGGGANGGDGLTNNITGSDVVYAGGGGGYGWTNNNTIASGLGGAGGGGAGRLNAAGGPNPGTYYGAGGGGSGDNSDGAKRTGGNGYQGIVIVRYVIPGAPKGLLIMLK
jgi:hypothetical protein